MANLKQATMAVMVTLMGSFFIRTAGTLYPGLFLNLFVVKVSILVHTACILSHLFFLFFFYSAYVSKKRETLRKGCILAIIGSSGIACLYAGKLAVVFGIGTAFPQFILNPLFNALAPFMGSFFHLVFFVIFRASLSPGEKQWLGRPMGSVIAGISLFLCFHGIVLVNFCLNEELRWLTQMPRMAAVPVLVAAALLIFHFYFRFYQYLPKKTGSNLDS